MLDLSAIYAGYALFIAGSLLSVLSINFSMMFIGRLLQGIGISSPRAVTLALVRDRYAGRSMARVMSFVITVFILVPMLAPSFGQAMLIFSGWRAIFLGFMLIAIVTLGWFALRTPETLAQENRTSFSLRQFRSSSEQTLMQGDIGPAVVMAEASARSGNARSAGQDRRPPARAGLYYGVRYPILQSQFLLSCTGQAPTGDRPREPACLPHLGET